MAFTVFGFPVSLPLVGTVLALVVGREIWKLTYFKRKGIPMDFPIPLLGHVHKMGKGIHLYTQDAQKRLGKIYGIYLFRVPAYFICDLDIIKDITVKSFSKFVNHKEASMQNKPFNESVNNLRDQHWKNVRNVITPTFSASKMKQMSPLINECCDHLVRNFGECQKKDGEIAVSRVFECFTMDGIAKCAFGLKVDSQINPDDPFISHARTMVNPSAKFKFIVMLIGIVPFLGKVLDYLNIPIIPRETMDFFTEVVEKTMAMRRERSPEDSTKMTDFLQLMVNAHEDGAGADDDDLGQDLHDQVDEHHGMDFFNAKQRSKTKLTATEVLAQALFFFVAGYETTNITLAFAAYSLATNPEVQDRLIEEIDEFTPTRDSVDYNSIAKMAYLDGVVCETLRLYPAAILTERECNETYTGHGITIPKGGQVLFPIFSIQRNEEYWPEPEKFDPSRFSKEGREARHPFAWMPFGAGPRNCIGMRFALMEVKMALVRLLQTYRLETNANTEVPVQLGTMNIKPKKGITLSVTERN